jgi:hypothetical protein
MWFLTFTVFSEVMEVVDSWPRGNMIIFFLTEDGLFFMLCSVYSFFRHNMF